MGKSIVLIVLSLLCLSALAEQKQTIRIGVLASRGIEQTHQLWAPTAQYLQGTVSGYQFTIVPLTAPGLHNALKNKQLEFVLTNTGHYVELEAEFAITRILTLDRLYQNHRLTQFGAVIFTRADHSAIQSLHDLRNKRFIGVKPYAFGGFRMAWSEFIKRGINPFTQFKQLSFSGFPVDKVVYAVQNGEYDAGTVRTGVLERLHAQGKIDISAFKILSEKRYPGFPLKISTELYPEWPLAKAANVSEQLSKRVVIALLQLQANSNVTSPVVENVWTVPLDYTKVHELFKNLKVGPYENLGRVTLKDILEQYWYIVALTFFVILALTLIIIYILSLDKKVRKSQYSLARAQEIAHIGNWEWNIGKNEMRWSDEIFHIFGLSEKRKSLNIEDFMNFIHTDDREFVKVSLNDALYHKKPLNIDHRIVAFDGTVRMVHQQAETSYDDNGKAVEMSGIIQDITERKSAEDRLRESEQELASILNNMQDTFFRISYNGRVCSISPSIAQLLGYETDEVVGRRFLNFMAKDECYRSLLEKLQKNYGRVDNYEMRLQHKSGTILIAAISAHYIYDESGDLDGIEGIARNISELIHTRDDLSREKEKIQTTLESIGDGVITTDISGVVDYMNAVAEQMTGVSLQQGRGMRLSDVLKINTGSSEETLDALLLEVLSGKSPVPKAVHEAVLVNEGNKYVVEVTLSSIRDYAMHTIGCVIVFHDLTEVYELGKKMAYQARHDVLTGLYNRRELELKIKNILDQTPDKSEHAILYMDLNNFKDINDCCGHVAGDELLKQTATLLKGKIRSIDVLARLGGDKFCLLLQNCPLTYAKNIAETLLAAVRELHFSWENSVYKLGINIGLVRFQNSGISVNEIMNHADIACYNAKEAGPNTMYVYSEDEVQVQQRKGESLWLGRLNKAFDDNRFTVYGQELVALNSDIDQQKYYELLVRMQDEQGNIVLPMAFIPAAERFKKITLLDRWIFDRTLALIEELQLGANDCRFMLNLSGQSVLDNEFKQYITQRISSSPDYKNKLCFEISESVVISNYAATAAFINELREFGCLFSLDDFGNGVSSFSYLKNLDVDWVKIDGALVRNIVENHVEYTIVQSINQIVQSMAKKTVAKCVENEKIEACLREIGVNYAQGYGLKKPIPFTPNVVITKSA